MESGLAENEDFNISSPRATSVRELASLVWASIHGTPLKLKHEDPFTYDVQVRSPDVTKAKDVLGFETTVALEDSIEEVITWMRGQHGL